MAKLLESFAVNLVSLRKKKGLTQEELGEKAKITRQSIARYEVRLGAPTFETVGDLARVFGVEETDLTQDPNLSEQIEFREKRAEWRGYEAGVRTMLGKYRPDVKPESELPFAGSLNRDEIQVIEAVAKRAQAPQFSAPVARIARDLESLNDPELLAVVAKTVKDVLAVAAKRNAGRASLKRKA